VRELLRQAVIPAAGLGTRFLPATKAQPKEMLPIFDKPSIQVVVEEAVAAGVREIVMVTGRSKQSITRHFGPSPELERFLRASGKHGQLEQVRRVSRLAKFTYRRQPVPLGLGHAILCSRPAIGKSHFAVMLPDDLVDSKVPAIRQLWNVHRRFGGSVVAIMEVPRSHVSMYGVVGGEWVAPGVMRVREMVEKPSLARAPSRFAVIGRYILSPRLFGILGRTRRGRGGEIQLTDAIRELARREPVYACRFHGKRYDAGDKAGYVQATVAFAMKEPAVRHHLRKMLKEVL